LRATTTPPRRHCRKKRALLIRGAEVADVQEDKKLA